MRVFSIHHAGYVFCLAASAIALPDAPHARTAQEPPPAPQTQPPPLREPAPEVPAWALEARWYEVLVPRFANGDEQNDPPGTLRWGTGWPPEGTGSAGAAAPPDSLLFGGDLEGVIARLTYVKELGFNTVLLAPVFAASDPLKLVSADLLHVDPSLASAGVEDKDALPACPSGFAPADCKLLKLIAEAHRKELRVVLSFEVPPHDADPIEEAARYEAHLLAAVQRWIDPDGNGKPGDGVDGWLVRKPDHLPRTFWQRWCRLVRETNPGLLLVADPQHDAPSWVAADLFHTVVDRASAEAVIRFVTTKPGAGVSHSQRLLDELMQQERLYPPPSARARLHVLGDVYAPRSLSRIHALTAWDRSEDSHDLREITLDRWRLAVLILYFASGTPCLLYGDEVGMTGHTPELSRGPMWWNAAQSPDYRADFTVFIRKLNIQRDTHESLRHGDMRNALVDDERRLFAFRRMVPGKEVTLVVNYGEEPQRIALRVAEPDRLVGVLTPAVRPAAPPRDPARPARQTATARPPENLMKLGGMRQQTNQHGEILLPVKPMAARVVLVWDEIP